MSLPEIIKEHIKRLGAEITERSKIDLKGRLERVDFTQLPESYQELLFGVRWPEESTYFFLSDDDKDYLESLEWDIEKFEEDEDSYVEEIEHWDYNRFNEPEHVLTYEMGPDSNMNSDYVQIAGDDNYTYLIDLLNIQKDGDPIVHKVYVYEEKEENIYFEMKYSKFLQHFYKENKSEVIKYFKQT